MAIQQVYKHSGAIGPAGVLVPAAGGVGALILSFLYGYISVYNPVAGYISFLITGGLAFGLVMLMFILSKVGKCRNPGFLYAMGGLIGAFALYASWVVFIYALVNRSYDDAELSLVSMFFTPSDIWATVLEINDTGWFTIKSWTPSGVVLWIFWGIEAAIIAGAPLIMAAGGIDDEVFCERCNEWCDSDIQFQLEIPSDASVIEHVSKGELNALEALTRVDGNVYPRLDVTFHLCKTCAKSAAYKVQQTRLEVDKEGNASEKHDDVTPLFIVAQDGVKRLQELHAKPVEVIEQGGDEALVSEEVAEMAEAGE